MIADSTEIRFACSRCGQRLSVDASGAGMRTTCPTCEQPLVVPQFAGLHDRSYGESETRDPLLSGYPAGEATVPASEAQELRDELAGAERRSGELESALAVARKDLARLRSQLEKAASESAEQKASAAAVQAEARRLQAERQQLHSELAESRQRADTAETQCGEARAKNAQLVAGLEAVEKSRLAWDAALSETKEHALGLEAQVAARESELRQSLDRLAASEAALQSARDEAGALETQRADLVRQTESLQAQLQDAAATRATLTAAEENLAAARLALATAGADHEALEAQHADLVCQTESLRAQLQDAAATRAALTAAEENLAAARLALTTAGADHEALSGECAALRRQIKVLRHDLAEVPAGRELLDLRERFQTLETGHRSTVASLARAEAQLQALTHSGQNLRAELTEARERAAAAENRAEASSESAMQSDNEVLRGIIARQNTVLEARFVELRRLKRARLGLRLIYALIVLVIVGVGALTFDAVPDVVKQFLHEWFGI